MAGKAETRSIASNTLWMTLASIAQKVISFGYFWFIAHQLPLETLGLYTFALSYTTLFSIGTDIGMASVLVRDGATDRSQLLGLYRRMMRLKVIASAITYGALIAVALLVGYGAEKLVLIAIAGVAMVLDSVHLTNYAALRALHDTRYEAIGMVGSQALTLVIGGVALTMGAPLGFLISAYAISSALNVVWSTVRLMRHPEVVALRKARAVEAVVSSWTIVQMAFPFALAGIFTRVYASLDAVLLERLAGDAALGLYSAPYKIAFAFQFIPMALVASLYPLLSHLAAHDRARIAPVFRAAMVYLLAIAIPLFAGTVVMGETVLVVLFGAKYSGAGTILSLMMASLIFAFASFPVGSVLNAMHKQQVQTMIMGVVMVVNAVLNFLLIPQWGATGAAIAAVAGYGVLFVAGSISMHKIAPIAWGVLWADVARISVAAMVMAAALVGMETLAWNFPVLIRVLIGCVIYGVLFMAVGGVALLRLRSAMSR